ncbi:MAG: hypothetical protein AB4368_07095 [Xenococcaceae cyanobacterium]
MNNRQIVSILSLSSILLFQTNPTQALSVNLYNGSGLPESQNYLDSAALDSAGQPVLMQKSIVANGVEIVSNANNAEYSGYTNHLPNPLNTSELVPINSGFPRLDRDTGYSIFFTVALDSNNNDFTDLSDDRAAFSITVIGTNNEGIELGFDRDRIFAQSSNFIREETTNNFPTSTFNSYELKVDSNGYELFANSTTTPILNGALRIYNFTPSASDPPLLFNPYETENFLFLGDNTGQAYGNFTLGAISVSSVPFNFSPTLGLALTGFGIWLRRKKL